MAKQQKAKAEPKAPTGLQIFLGEMLIPMFLQYGKESAKAAIQKAIDEDEDGSTGELVKVANVSLYPVTDTVIENFAKKTKTKVDDKTVAQLKAMQEELAEDGGYELPNIDAGTEGD